MEPSGKVSLDQDHQLRLVAGHHVPPDGRLDLVHGNYVRALVALHLLGLGEEGV